MQNYRYRLQPKNIKYDCPYCGQKRCFKPYIDTATGQEVGDGCGRCDHEHSCGQHVKPGEYFRDHPDKRPSSNCKPLTATEPAKALPIGTIPFDWVEKSHSKASVFYNWLERIVGNAESLQRTFDRYHLGATRKGEVIYWQIDIRNRVRGGKIMAYSATGHRQGTPSWVHTRMQNRGQLPGDWRLGQCLFGEHLLAQSDSAIMLVESEKTAFVCDIFYPQYTWLATGGCKGLTAAKSEVLAGRKVAVLPDSGCYDAWRKVLNGCPGLCYSISDALEHYPPNTDIADLLLAQIEQRPRIDTTDDLFADNNYDTCPY